MNAKQESQVRDRLVSVITDTSTPIRKLPQLVTALMNFEHCMHEIKLNPVKKEERKGVGFKND